jgi:hypothetical protein
MGATEFWTTTTIAVGAGQSPGIVAQSLGHVNDRVTRAHYIEAEAVENADRLRVFTLLQGVTRSEGQLDHC